MSRGFDFDPSTRQQMGVLQSNELVIDRHESHSHLSGKDLETALFLVDAAERDFIVEAVDCGEIVGHSRCVETDPQDLIVYAYRHGRAGLTRFVLDREPEPTTSATVVLKRHDDRPGVMILISSWAGHESQPEPWDENLRDEESRAASRAFWSNHALTLSETQIQTEIDTARPHGTAKEMAKYATTMFFSEPS